MMGACEVQADVSNPYASRTSNEHFQLHSWLYGYLRIRPSDHLRIHIYRVLKKPASCVAQSIQHSLAL